jgi:hypothetical protein
MVALRAQRTALQARLEQLWRDHAQATYEVRPTTDRFVGAETSHMRSEYAHPGLPRTSGVRLPKGARGGGGAEESQMTAKGVPIDGKRSPHCYPQEESPFSLKEESHWPPWDSVLKRSPILA